MFVGGHVALDLVNTVAWRLDPARREERLPDDDALRRWAEAAGFTVAPDGGVAEVREAAHQVPEPPSTVPDGDVAEVRELREAAHQAPEPPSTVRDGCVAEVRELREAAHRVLEPGGGVAEVRELREAAHRVLEPLATGAEPGDVEPLRRLIVGALARAEVVSVVPLEWRIPLHGTRDLRDALALETWRLLQFEDLTRLRRCADEGCGWLFLDRSRNGSRRWCSSADCGNRERARRHYHRARH
ncbi:CGNR zinc finger domain-containing protein [Amycolatopsis tucumanensis]|uniref:CGNR zinc finger domain-containing protein n=1 Tax=Amycolatopsis tucumanensis TaxID=401106 RepID=A0ABP7JUY4_9PSEU|nr:CGNR zinc finger domain-containing protein [Amycolatopsis tucumanensis]MCF6426435.1 CGNR zinc finger domain-containing protein [Amycolatopsis tucumanensis]